ncbi:MAG: hypothetical protein ACI865_003143 [Flavobacteriaceae bacterium]|jgi:hypothetical protein
MKKITLCLAAAAISLAGYSQNDGGSFTGNIESTFQYLNEDTLIDALQPDSKGLMNTYMNVFYTNGRFKGGMRFESYLPRIQGYPNRFDGTGLGMRYIGYTDDFFDVTLGSFYEQFGSGMIFRAYEDRGLGYDNLMDGARVIIRPANGVTLKGVYGKQRLSFQEGKIVHSDGIVRGMDGDVNLNAAFKALARKKLKVSLGASFMSKFQEDDRDDIILPENVGSYGGRLRLKYKKFSLDGEYIIKEQDPSVDNNYNYNYGHAALVNFGFSQKGLGIALSAKSVDNMSYRSDRTKDLQDVFINYLPAMNKTHTYNLVSSLYPYATQPVGEIAYQAEVLYTIKRGSKLGGKYGTSINANFSTAYLPTRNTDGIDPTDSTGVAYVSKPFGMSDSLLWRDINVNIYHKFSKTFNLRLSYFNLSLNNDVAKVTGDAHGLIQSHIGVIEAGYKINKKHSIRAELQGLFIADDENGDVNDKGNWATVLIEYNVSPHWFFSILDQFNYGNPKDELKLHYMYGSFGYIKESTRITVGYGRQRAGLFCVGGVCRFVPASNGLTLSFTQSF